MNSKKGAMSNFNKIVVLAVVVMAVFGGLYLFGDNIKASFGGAKLTAEEAVTETTVTETGTEVPKTATVSCPNDKNVDGQSRYIDTLSTNKDKVANIVSYMVPVGRTDITRVSLSNTTAAGDGFSTAVNVPCDVDTPITYEPIAVTKLFGAISGLGFQSSMSPQVVAGKSDRLQVTFNGKRQDWIRVRGINNQNPATSNALNNSNLSSTTFAAINVADATTTGSPDQAGVVYKASGQSDLTNLTLAADDFLDLTFKFKTNQTKSQFGEDGLRTFMVVDAAKSKWDLPVVSGHNIKKIEFADLNVDDANVLSLYEYIYVIDPVTENEGTINFYLKTASGINPVEGDDPCILFAVEGRYNSIELTDQVRTSIYEDSSANTQVAFSQANKLCIDVD